MNKLGDFVKYETQWCFEKARLKQGEYMIITSSDENVCFACAKGILGGC